MTLESLLQTDLWHEFQKRVRSEKRSAPDVLADLIQEYLETREDAEIHDAMARKARKSGYREKDAVNIVRQVRAMRGR